MSKIFYYSVTDVKDVQPGEVFMMHGQHWVLNKKTTTAISVSPYRWYNRLADWLDKRDRKVHDDNAGGPLVHV